MQLAHPMGTRGGMVGFSYQLDQSAAGPSLAAHDS